MKPLETQARQLGNNRKRLQKRLNEAKAVLKDEYKSAFKETIFDFQHKRLIGNGYYLQWQLRPQPNQPESSKNQQTNVGIVYLYKSMQFLDVSEL